MRRAVRIIISLVLVAGCSRSGAQAVGTAEEPWNEVSSDAPEGWWRTWDASLGGQAPHYGVGTQFEIETLGPHGIRMVEVLEVLEIKPHQVPGRFELVLQSSKSDRPYGGVYLPPNLEVTWYGNYGHVTPRNEKLVSVTVPAGTFAAGRYYKAEQVGDVSYQRDIWVVPEIPFAIQTWSRPLAAKELYNPPPDGTIPEGTTLTRLVRMEKK